MNEQHSPQAAPAAPAAPEPHHLPLVLFPAYGRVYEGREAALADWHAGKDFKIARGPYCSRRDLAQIRANGWACLVFLVNGPMGRSLKVVGLDEA